MYSFPINKWTHFDQCMDHFLINKLNSRACRSGRSTGAVHSSYRHDHVTITERPAHSHRPWSAGIYSPLSQLERDPKLDPIWIPKLIENHSNIDSKCTLDPKTYPAWIAKWIQTELCEWSWSWSWAWPRSWS